MASTSMKLTLSILLFLALGFIFAFGTGTHEQFVYSSFAGSNITLDGAARITSTGLIELTNDSAWIKGHAFYPSPLRFRQSPNGTVQSFSVSFVFGFVSSFGNIRSHGFAFFIGPSNDFTSAFPIQFLGLFNSTNNGSSTNHIFAIELDTILNTEFGDISDNHVGIDINGPNSFKSFPAGFYDDGTFKSLAIIGDGPIQAWVEYDATTTQIDVTIAPLGFPKPAQTLISSMFDLSKILIEHAYVGFSSSTGSSTGHRHCVLGWSFGINSPAPVIDSTKLPKLPYFGPRSPSNKLLKIILPIASALLILVTGSSAVVLVRRHFRYKEVREDWEVEYGPHQFSYNDLFHATKGFNSKHLLGVGGFGSVYKGVLPASKLEVAVKRASYNSKQGIKQFIAEVVSIGHLRHKNVVQLHGYCRRKGELLLVYDYMVNGSLDKYLHGKEGKATLDWHQRFKIIRDIAFGLLYLHEEWDKVVIHRDVKPTNVLLDRDLNGRLADFGLAKLYDHGTDPQTTHVAGTIGYLAPELVHRGKATTLIDVFAFGIFILEVTCGKKPITEDIHGNQLMLVDWVISNWHKQSLLDVMDIKLQGNYDTSEAFLALKLGLMCSHPFPDARPTMRQVLQYLDNDMALPELPPENFSFHMLALMQNKGQFNLSMMPLNPSPVTNAGSVSFSLDGR